MLSVIIPAHNAAGTLGKLLVSVKEFGGGGVETIVVDDGSTDGTADLARRHGATVLEQANQGPGTARNRGAAIAANELLLFLDADVVLGRTTVGNGLRALRERAADVVNGVYAPEPANRGLVPLYKCLMDHYLFTQGDLERYPVFEARCALARKKVFAETGGFNERLSFRIPVENQEFGHRVSRKFKMILDPSVQVAHHFPGFGRLARLYFWRTFWWMKFFRHEARCLTKSAPTTAGSARGVAAGSGLLPLLLASFAFPPLVVPALLLLLAHVLQFRKFYALAWERNPLLLPPYLVLSGIFSAVIVSGAAVSLADSLLRSLFGDDSHERLFSHR